MGFRANRVQFFALSAANLQMRGQFLQVLAIWFSGLTVVTTIMRIKTHFPLDLPHIPLVPHHTRDKILRRVLKEQIGKLVEVEIDGETFEAEIIEIRQVEGGFDTVVEYQEDE